MWVCCAHGMWVCCARPSLTRSGWCRPPTWTCTLRIWRAASRCTWAIGWGRGPTHLFRGSTTGLVANLERGCLLVEGGELAAGEHEAGPALAAADDFEPAAAAAVAEAPLGEGERLCVETRGEAC
ncbi:unnamed protein product [Prorocentrum cordatum]|uniref:Altered inheritance of mitochondria protein 24, mitochondrial n=1 Tax=Prorocentrum cordatum TaxID=2364126 RepID=A0ABN9URC5_9DINO|nr:unnamed protein product [Polarella glacialis]